MDTDKESGFSGLRLAAPPVDDFYPQVDTGDNSNSVISVSTGVHPWLF